MFKRFIEKLPPFVFVKKFWEALSFLIAGILGLLVVFGLLAPEYAIGAGVLLSWFLTALKWFGIEPKFRVWSLPQPAPKAKSKK